MSFAVDLELLTQLIDRMTVTQRELERVDDAVDARMKRLHATWQGSAAGLHAEAHQKWTAGARQMRDALATLHSIARTADANYTAAVRANVQMWSQ
ncbi:WXG100 family type VII secretion target [Jatrophihabitans fulvus]